jgi:hypothetical protein
MKLSQWLRGAATVAGVLWLAGCAGLGGPRTITLSEAELTRLVEAHAPFQKRLLEVLDVRVSAPRVRLLPESNRLATEMQVSTTERASGQIYQGRIAVNYALRFDDASQAIRLTQVRVITFQLDHLPAPRQAAINRLGGLIAEQLLDDLALYRFKPGELGTAGARGVRPSAVTVTQRGVEITLAASPP